MSKPIAGHQYKVNILALNRIKIINEKNEIILLSSLWKEQPAVIVFIRHFGCIGCSSHIDQIWSMREQLEKNGTRIFFIGSGSPYLISEFKKEHKLANTQVFTDPGLESFKAAGLLQINFDKLDEQSLEKIAELEKKGYTNRIYEGSGSITQLGGVVAIKPSGTVTYHFVSEFIGDFDQPTDWK